MWHQLNNLQVWLQTFERCRRVISLVFTVPVSKVWLLLAWHHSDRVVFTVPVTNLWTLPAGHQLNRLFWVPIIKQNKTKHDNAKSETKLTFGVLKQDRNTVMMMMVMMMTMDWYSSRGWNSSVGRATDWTLNIRTTGSHIIVWTHKHTTHTVGMGIAAFAAVVPYPGKATRILHKGQRSYKNKINKKKS